MNDRANEGLRMRLRDLFDDVDVLGRESDARSRFGEVDDRQSDEKRGRGRDFKKDQRFESHPANFFQRTCACDADDDGRENQRRDNGFDQVDENIAEKINFVAPIRPQPSEQCADDKTDHDLRGQRWPIPRAAGCRSCVHSMFCVSCD